MNLTLVGLFIGQLVEMNNHMGKYILMNRTGKSQMTSGA